jgi:hypothetical protein
MLVISCHADTGFPSHRLRRLPDGQVEGHLDNFIGVHAVMQAYFSGRLDGAGVRIELTWGEEDGMLGARQVLRTLQPADTVIVVDVTGTPTKKDFVIEKCRDESLRADLEAALGDLRYDLYAGCLDPIWTFDEADVYEPLCRRTCFLGVPCTGGDYNAGLVRAQVASVDAVAEALCRLAAALARP